MEPYSRGRHWRIRSCWCGLRDLAVQPAQVGGSASFVMLHLTGAVFGPGAVVTVDLGYDVDQFGSLSGAEFWTRPLDPDRFGQTVRVTFSGPAGGVTLLEYGSGEPMDSNEFPYNQVSSRAATRTLMSFCTTVPTSNRSTRRVFDATTRSPGCRPRPRRPRVRSWGSQRQGSS